VPNLSPQIRKEKDEGWFYRKIRRPLFVLVIQRVARCNSVLRFQAPTTLLIRLPRWSAQSSLFILFTRFQRILFFRLFGTVRESLGVSEGPEPFIRIDGPRQHALA